MLLFYNFRIQPGLSADGPRPHVGSGGPLRFGRPRPPRLCGRPQAPRRRWPVAHCGAGGPHPPRPPQAAPGRLRGPISPCSNITCVTIPVKKTYIYFFCFACLAKQKLQNIITALSTPTPMESDCKSLCESNA